MDTSVDLKKEVRREDIVLFEQAMNTMPGVEFGDNEKCPLKHSFADGVYMREIFIPKDTLIVGKIHKHAHPNFLMKGDVSVVTEAGIERLKAPLSMISPAGTKRIVYAHEDTIWVTIHVTDERDLEKIEEAVIAKDYNEYDSLEVSKLIDSIKKEVV